MDEKNNNEMNPEEEVLEPALQEPVPGEELGPDDTAMDAAGLVTPEEAQTDQLIADAKSASGMDSLPTEEFKDEEYREIFGEGEDLERVFSDEPYEQPAEEPAEEPELPEAPAEPAEELSLRKGRPRRKKGYGLLGIPHIIASAIWLAIAVAVGVSLGRVAWVCAADVLAFGREDKEVVVTIDDADTLDDIADKLQEGGLIRYPGLFKLYGTFTGAREDISSGTFTLNTIYDYHALVGEMNYYSATREIVQVVIPEGYTCEQMFALLEEHGVCTVEKLENYAATGELDDYWFLEGVERGDRYSLEGYLFPDTYEFYQNDEAEQVLEKMLDDFEYRFDDELRAQIDTLNERLATRLRSRGFDDAYIEEHKMTMRDVVTVASLIEKETSGDEESFKISSVIYNRLTNPGEYPYLNIDAALLYALGHKEALTTEDLQADTPYNTYKYKGLIPGPIANPGLNSLKAALNPADTDYYYYALDPKAGAHHFTRSLAEHEAFLASLGG